MAYPLAALGVQVPQVEDPMQAYARAQALKSLIGQQQIQQQQVQQAGIQTQMLQQQQRDQQIWTQALLQSGGDPDKASQIAQQSGASGQSVMQHNQALLQYREGLTKLATSQLDLDKAKFDNIGKQNNLIANAIDAVKTSKDPATEYQNQLANLTRQGVNTSGIPQQYDPNQIAIAEASAKGAQKLHQEAKEQADLQLSQGKLGMLNQYGTESPTDMDKGIRDYLQSHNLPNTAQNREIARDAWIKQTKVVPQVAVYNAQAAAGGGVLNDEALDLAARLYRSTGELPRNYRSPGMITAVMNRAGQIDKEEGTTDIASNRAVYQANTASLRKLQSQSDALQAFENTGLKNLNQFLGTAKKVVDSGSPWINQPLRAVSQQGMGSADMAAFNAARQVATVEIARVLNNPGLTGVLSDTARAEVNSLISPNANLQQIYSAANILKQDMENRRVSYNQQISDIQQRMKGTQKPEQNQWKAPADAPQAPKENGHKLVKNGQILAVSQGGEWVQP